MRTFADRDFLLMTETAKQLYRTYAKDQPIFDFHCHLSPQEIYEDHSFEDLTEAWLGADHYKWRLMRAYGCDEELITGKAAPRAKFRAFAQTLSRAVGNPIYHWSHLELRQFFGIEDVLDEETADEIYDRATQLLRNGLTARKLMEKSGVRAVFTTDDPADDLRWHKKIREDESFEIEVRPAFRPDRFIHIENEGFDQALRQLEQVAETEIRCFSDLLRALDRRIDYFAEQGCRASDHALSDYHFVEASEEEVERIFGAGTSGRRTELTQRETDAYQTALLLHLARRYRKLGWPMELHLQPIRNNHPKRFRELGPDRGFDSILDGPIARPLNQLLGCLAETEELPPTVLFSLNPCDLTTLATTMGNFQEGPQRGKMQLGVPWWFNDTKEGMIEHLHVLASEGLLSTCIGMLTDSRSFLSYARHDYFRRILCNYMGELIENGEYPNRPAFVGQIIGDICFNNAARYFSMEEELGL